MYLYCVIEQQAKIPDVRQLRNEIDKLQIANSQLSKTLDDYLNAKKKNASATTLKKFLKKFQANARTFQARYRAFKIVYVRTPTIPTEVSGLGGDVISGAGGTMATTQPVTKIKTVLKNLVTRMNTLDSKLYKIDLKETSCTYIDLRDSKFTDE